MNEAAGAESPRGFPSTMAAVYATPGEAFAAIAARPSFWAPLLVFIAAGLVFNAVWLHELDPAEFARLQIEDSPFAEQMSSEQRADGIERQARIFPYVAWLGPLVFSPLAVLLVALVYLFFFRFFYGAEVTFKQSLSIVAWAFLAVTLVSMPLTLLVLYLREDWNVDPRTALQANLTLLLDRGSVPRAVYSIAESLDLLSAWALALLSMGYAAATGRRAGQAVIGVAAMWALYVLGKAALSAVF